MRAGVTKQLAEGVYVIPDQRVNLVPNAGIIVGREGVLVIDTGMGPRNAETVLEEVRKITDKKILYLTTTHFHPEHGMGAQAFPASTTIIYPQAQKEELFEKADFFLELFRGFSPEIAELLAEVRVVAPDVTFDREAEINLGDFIVRLLHLGRAHTRGDNFVFLPQQKILFGGDVVLNRFFPILPDPDACGSCWIEILDRLDALDPVQVVPGHGAVGGRALITHMKEYLVSLRARVKQLHEQGKSKEEIETQVSAEFRKQYADWGNPEWLKNAIENFYAELGR
jgi:glyoxylase-like metal-dependent hydrolase (beta-lactamase superfamily II)